MREPGPRAHLLIAEDDLPLARLLSQCLQAEQYSADLVHDGEQALALLMAPPHSGGYDVLLLDLSLPKMDGLSLLAEIHRALPSQPVLVLTGRTGTQELVRALNTGADDYLTKPFSVEELLARLGALVRRRRVVPTLAASAAPAPDRVADHALVVDRENHRVHRGSREIELTPREFDLLEFLLEQAPRPVPRQVLMERVWRVPYDPKTNIVDVYMKYLRDKIEIGDEPKLIRTVRGIGYALVTS